MNKINKKKLLNYIIAPLLLTILLFLIYKQISAKDSLLGEWNNFVDYFKAGNKVLFVLVLLLAPLNWMLEAKKWQWLLQKIEPLSFRKAWASTLTGIAFALVTPNKIGDFAGRILYLSNKTKLRGAIATLIGNLAQTIVVFLFGIIGGVILSLIGLFIGMNIGGNYFTSFEFMGQRGYEAVGYLGALIGAIVGFLFGVLLGDRQSEKIGE